MRAFPVAPCRRSLGTTSRSATRHDERMRCIGTTSAAVLPRQDEARPPWLLQCARNGAAPARRHRKCPKSTFGPLSGAGVETGSVTAPFTRAVAQIAQANNWPVSRPPISLASVREALRTPETARAADAEGFVRQPHAKAIAHPASRSDPWTGRTPSLARVSTTASVPVPPLSLVDVETPATKRHAPTSPRKQQPGSRTRSDGAVGPRRSSTRGSLSQRAPLAELPRKVVSGGR